MSLAKAIRLTRLHVKSDSNVQLKIETKTGKQFTLPVLNCSLTGIATAAPIKEELGDELCEDDIVPAAKLIFGDHEATLGRLVVKRVPLDDEKKMNLGFATIDAKVPVDGALSQHFETDFGKPQSPFEHELASKHFSIANFVGIDMNNVDIFDRARKFNIFYQDWQKSEKFGYIMARDNSQGSRINLTRKRASGRNDYIMMGSNDYLGLASRKEVKEAAIDAINKYGFGSTGTPHTSGYSVLHDKLCKKIASLYGKEDAIIYASGYSANVGIVSGLCREQDLIVADTLAHASIHDGITMSRATCRLYKHNDMTHLEKILQENRSQYGGCLIATEGAFSMDGTIGKLDEIIRLARKYNARVFIDQAHCLGVVGPTGMGTTEKYNLNAETDVIMGLFSKSLGGVGGFVTGSADLCNWLRSFSRGYIFATSFPPANAAAVIKALDIMQSEDLVQKLQSNVKHFISGLRQLGAPLDSNHETAIVPIEIRNEQKMGKMYQSLLESGVFVIPVVYPVVSRNRCRFRFSVRADLSLSDLDYVIAAFERAMKVADFSFDELKEEKKAA